MSLLVALFVWVWHAILVDPAPIEVDPVPIDPFEPGAPGFDPRLDTAPPWLPDPAVSTPYTGEGVQPTWDDVYKWSETEFNKRYAGGFNISQDLRSQGGLDIGRTAIGTTIKAISGFVNNTVDLVQSEIAQIYSTLQFVLGSLDQTDQELFRRVHNLQNEVNGLATIVIAEEAQIVQLHDTIFAAVEFEGKYIQEWAVRTIFAPLLTEMAKIGPETDRKILLSDRNVLDQAHADTLTQLAPVVAVATALATKVATLVTESNDCVKPMCSTMGPNTPLGKLLKGIEAAGLIALLLELSNLTAGELDDQVAAIAGWGTKVIGVLDDLFFAGGEKLGDVLASLPG